MHHHDQIVPWGDEESLAALQRKLDVDILVNGHTHKMKVTNFGGKCILNPGSATGAYSPITRSVISIILKYFSSFFFGLVMWHHRLFCLQLREIPLTFMFMR